MHQGVVFVTSSNRLIFYDVQGLCKFKTASRRKHQLVEDLESLGIVTDRRQSVAQLQESLLRHIEDHVCWVKAGEMFCHI